MSIDITQFFQTYVEESLEMLEDVEKALLRLNIDAKDTETIHLIFRAIHSIKGNSAVFGFTPITVFTHSAESFLDLARSGAHDLSQNDIELLFKVVDCLRTMITCIQEKKNIDEDVSKKLSEEFKTKIQRIGTATAPKEEHIKPVITEPLIEKIEEKTTDNAQPTGWQIIFHPSRTIFQKGSDPIRVFRVLEELGNLESHLDMSELPDFSMIDPTKCYLVWQLKLKGNIKKNDIKEVFIWIANNENVTIIPLQSDDKPLKSSITTGKEPFSPFIAQKTSVHVAIDKIDNLINIVGEFVITKSMLTQIIKNFDMSKIRDLNEVVTSLENTSRELQESVMSIRMVPIEFVFNRLPRLVHEMTQKTGKQVELVITGEQTELDKNIIEKLVDPLIHLVRNSLDHGIELPNVRTAKGKSPEGQIQLHAYQEGECVLIDIIDDGAGLNKESIRKKAIAKGLITKDTELTDDKLYEVIFNPGFSTADTITDVSGRGVGLDVVQRNITELGGEIRVESSENAGCIFSLRLPLTLAIMDCQLVKIGEQIYIIPIINITEIVKVDKQNVSRLDNKTELYYFRDKYLPIVFLKDVFSVPDSTNDLENKFLVVVEIADQAICLVADEILLQQQVVIKSLDENYGEITGLSGVTILGNGRVALIVDVKALIDIALNKKILLDKPQENELIDATPEKVTSLDDNMQFLSFLMAGQEYAIDITEIKEIRMWENSTILPNTPPYIKGIINLRGMIIPIVDLLQRFSIKKTEHGRNTAIITLTVKHGKKNRLIGIVVDQVINTYSVNANEVKELPADFQSTMRHHVRGLVTIENKMITLLSTKNLIPTYTQQENAP